MGVIRIPYRPRYPEVHAELERRRFCVLVAHRRFGKTVLAVNHLIRQAARFAMRHGHFGYVAPLRTQAKAVAWDYLKHYTRNFPGRKVNETELAVSIPSPGGGARIRIFGADNPDSLRGLYFDGIVLDEVAQMKPDVWEEIIQPALADRQGFAVFIGTPKGVNLFSRLYHHAIARQAAGDEQWGALSYPVTSTRALPPAEVERLREDLSDAKFRQELLCDFMASADDILIPLDDVNAALTRQPDERLMNEWPIIVGVDVARFGEDASVFIGRRGPCAMSPRVYRKKSNTDVARLLAGFIGEIKPQHVCIDQGQGTGVIDLVKELCPGTVVTEVPFGSQALDNKRYVNRRSEMWHLMGQWLKQGSLTHDYAEAFRAELTAPSYSYDAAGRLRLEPKEEIKKRLKHSTDIGDALALTFAVRLQPLCQPRRSLWDVPEQAAEYDPFA